MTVRRKAAQGGLVVLALLLASSGALRLGAGIGQALANAEAHVSTASPPALDCPAPPAALVTALQAREADIAMRESHAADKEAALSLAGQAIEARLKTLAEAETKLSATLSLADGAAEADLAQLTQMYQTMKPKDAGPLFQTMAPDFAAGFLGRMRPDAAAMILAAMSPEAAYSVSVLLAVRNAGVPKN